MFGNQGGKFSSKDTLRDEEGGYFPTLKLWKSFDYGPIQLDKNRAVFDLSEISIGKNNVSIDDDPSGLS